MRKLFKLAGLVGIFIVVAGTWLTGWGSLLWHAVALGLSPPDPALPHRGLSDYRLDGEPVVIQGIAGNLSGLTFNHASGTLFATVNRPAEVLELSVTGAVLRRLPVQGASDLEGISHVRDDLYLLVDEANQRVSWVTIGRDATGVDLTGAEYMDFGRSRFRNLGIEALSWDDARDRLWIGQEMWPQSILSVSGLEKARTGQGLSLEITPWAPRLRLGGALMDLSSMTVDDPTGNLLLLSDLSAVIAEFSPLGEPLGLLFLWAGRAGLDQGVPQAEGIAIGTDGTIHVVSEPNLLYSFKHPEAPRDPPAR